MHIVTDHEICSFERQRCNLVQATLLFRSRCLFCVLKQKNLLLSKSTPVPRIF